MRWVRRQRPAGAGEHDLGPLLLGQLGHAEGERGVGEHAGDEDALAVEESHCVSRPSTGGGRYRSGSQVQVEPAATHGISKRPMPARSVRPSIAAGQGDRRRRSSWCRRVALAASASRRRTRRRWRPSPMSTCARRSCSHAGRSPLGPDGVGRRPTSTRLGRDQLGRCRRGAGTRRRARRRPRSRRGRARRGGDRLAACCRCGRGHRRHRTHGRRYVVGWFRAGTPTGRLPAVQIGILGGTGPAGSALAARLARSGYDVGGRLAVEVPGHGGGRHAARRSGPAETLTIEAGDNDDAADADVVVIATPWDGAAQTAAVGREHAAGQGRHLDGQRPHPHRQGVPAAGAAPRARWRPASRPPCPTARWPPRFHHVPAKELGDLDHPIETDVLICSDHPAATAATAELVAKIPNMRPLDAGELSPGHADRVVHRRAAAAQRALQDPGRGEVHRHPRRRADRRSPEPTGRGRRR